jgi:hypothetical protein
MDISVGTILMTILAGGVGAGLISFISNIVMFKIQRNAAKEDKKEELDGWKNEIIDRLGKDENKTDYVANKIDEIKQGQKIILYDRIRYLGKNYIKAGEIEFDDRAILHKMHNAYKALGGDDEGDDLSTIMKEIDELKTKT